MVRRHFGRDHHPVRRKLAQVLVTIAWPPAVLLHLWQVRQGRGPQQEALLKRVTGALWAAIRHNILPSEYYEYELWHPDRRMNIDNYLYNNEAPRLFKVLNRPPFVASEFDSIGPSSRFTSRRVGGSRWRFIIDTLMESSRAVRG